MFKSEDGLTMWGMIVPGTVYHVMCALLKVSTAISTCLSVRVETWDTPTLETRKLMKTLTPATAPDTMFQVRIF